MGEGTVDILVVDRIESKLLLDPMQCAHDRDGRRGCLRRP